MIYPIIGIVSITLIGFIAHRVGICLVKAVKQLLDGQPSLLLAILMSGLWVGAYSVLANYNNWWIPFSRFDFHLLFALGGFIFGIGASVNQGCSVSTLHQFARGNTSMLFTMVGWFIGWLIWTSLLAEYSVTVGYEELAPLSSSAVILMFSLCVIFTALMMVLFSTRARTLARNIFDWYVGRGVILYRTEMGTKQSDSRHRCCNI